MSASFWGGAFETLSVVSIFVVVGLGWAAWHASAYSPHVMSHDAMHNEEPTVWLVDGFNLLHAAILRGPDRSAWWAAPARQRVVDLASKLETAHPEVEIYVVFDGERDPDEPTEGDPRLRRVFAPSADDWMVRHARQWASERAVAVVTADRKLAARARHHGADIISPRAFARRCQGAPSQLPPELERS